MSTEQAPDDGSKNRDLEGLDGDAMQRLQSQVNGMSDVVDRVEETVASLEAEIDHLRDELESEREQRLELERKLSGRVNEIDERTDMLSKIEDRGKSDGHQRTAALIQHLRRKAERKRRKGGDPRVRIDRDGTEDALHYPDETHRTTYYDDMKRVVEWLVGSVDNATSSDVAWYDDGELYLDLSNGTVRLPRPRDSRGARPQPAGGDESCGRSTTETDGSGGRNTGDSAGQLSEQHKTR